MKRGFIDIHCHPALKPFGRSFSRTKTTKRNSPNRLRINSVYHKSGVNPAKKKLNALLTLTKFTQADFITCHEGGAKILVISLYPMEKNMVLTKVNGSGSLFGRLLRNLATGIGIQRIRHLQEMTDYFEDLKDEYQFYKELDGIKIIFNDKKLRYKMVRNYQEILDWKDDGVPTFFIVMSIEGCHVFNTGLELAGRPIADVQTVLNNVKEVKGWEFRPFFVGLTHHFDNELCGHEKSITGLANAIIKQKVDQEQGITPLGHRVISSLLNNENNDRILIDLKHMNVKSRYEYYELVKADYGSSIPFIVSHGAVNGRNNPEDNNIVDSSFNGDTINFYDDEIFRIARSKGIFGIQLDERRIVAKKPIGPFIGRKKSSELIWRQIEHVAKYLDLLDFPAWDIQCLGTDFDGIIDPLPGFWGAKDLDKLPEFLEEHANNFLNSERGKSLKSKNRPSAVRIIEKFMCTNAEVFLKKHFV